MATLGYTILRQSNTTPPEFTLADACQPSKELCILYMREDYYQQIKRGIVNVEWVSIEPTSDSDTFEVYFNTRREVDRGWIVSSIEIEETRVLEARLHVIGVPRRLGTRVQAQVARKAVANDQTRKADSTPKRTREILIYKSSDEKHALADTEVKNPINIRMADRAALGVARDFYGDVIEEMRQMWRKKSC